MCPFQKTIQEKNDDDPVFFCSTHCRSGDGSRVRGPLIRPGRMGLCSLYLKAQGLPFLVATVKALPPGGLFLSEPFSCACAIVSLHCHY